MSIRIHFPDPEYAEAFRAYSNYLAALAEDIDGRYREGVGVAGRVIEASLALATAAGVERRDRPQERPGLAGSLNKAWSNLRLLDHELGGDAEDFDDESNAWMPVQAYYSAYGAVRSLAAASGQVVPSEHRKALRLISEQVRRGLLPEPWSLFCRGCPQLGTQTFGGMDREPASVNPLTSPNPETDRDRLAGFLRTTREKELERIFREARRQNTAPGRRSRNLRPEEKARMAENLHATTIFDILYRLRKKAHYEDADTFVLGAAGPADAYEFARALMAVTDGSVAAIEGVVISYVGIGEYGRMLRQSRSVRRAGPGSVIGTRVEWLRARGVGGP